MTAILTEIALRIPSVYADLIAFPTPEPEKEKGAVPFVLVSAALLATYFIYKRYGRKKK